MWGFVCYAFTHKFRINLCTLRCLLNLSCVLCRGDISFSTLCSLEPRVTLVRCWSNSLQDCPDQGESKGRRNCGIHPAISPWYMKVPYASSAIVSFPLLLILLGADFISAPRPEERWRADTDIGPVPRPQRGEMESGQ